VLRGFLVVEQEDDGAEFKHILQASILAVLADMVSIWWVIVTP
jgi:hypothetical protein